MQMFAQTLRLLSAALIAGSVAAQGSNDVRIGGSADESAALERPSAIHVVDGRIIVLESGAPFVRVFGLDGRLRQRLGRAGAGPGEIRYGAALLVDSAARRVLVFDTPNGRAVEFAVEDSLRFTRSFATPLPVSGACTLGGRLFVAAYTSDGMIHELRPQGAELRIVRSFGDAKWDEAPVKHPSFTDYIGSGSLHCDSRRELVRLASREVGVLHVVGADGTGQRTVRLASFQSLAFSITADGWLRLAMPESGRYDQVLDFREEAGGPRISVGRASREHPGAGDYAEFYEIRIGPGDAQQASAPSRWQLVGRTADRTVCYRTAPAPEIAIVQGSACPSAVGA